MWGFLGVCILLILFCEFCKIGFEAFCKFAAGQHDAPSAAFTFEADIRAETRDGPFVGTARVLFTEPQVIVEFEIGKHINNDYIAFINGAILCKRIVINYGREK